jgi:hypothetical protein
MHRDHDDIPLALDRLYLVSNGAHGGGRQVRDPGKAILSTHGLDLYRTFEAPGAAFPSRYVAVAIVAAYFSCRYLPRICRAHLDKRCHPLQGGG